MDSKKNKLIVMYTVDRKNPKNTWSGSAYALKEALRSKFDIEFVDLHEGKFLNLLNKLKRLSLSGYLFGMLHDFFLYKKAQILLSKFEKSIPVLEITKEIPLNRPYYLYLDLTVSVLPDIQRDLNDYLSESSGGLLNNVSNKEITRRIWEQKKIFNSINKVFFMGNWITQIMKETYPSIENKFVAVGGGLHGDFILPLPSDLKYKKNWIVFNGIDFERKGGPLVVDAFQIMIDKYSTDAELYVIGPPKNIYPHHSNRIHFTGRLNRQEISKLYRQSKVLCVPSVFEAYGLVFPEAKSFGMLCIGRNKYEMPYFIPKEYGELITHDNPEELADIMFNLLNDTVRLQYSIDHIQEAQQEYSWNNVAGRIAKIICNDQKNRSCLLFPR